MTKSNITVVSVSYRSASLTIDSLNSVFKEKENQDDLSVKAVVVDNASGDAPEVQAYVDEQGWDSWVTVLTAPYNGGFGYGNNLAIRHAMQNWDVDFFQLLNPDAVINGSALKPLAAFMQQNTRVGITGSQINNVDGGLESSAHRFHSPVNELIESARLGVISKLLGDHELNLPLSDEPFKCDWVCGASMMIRRELLEEIGLFDEHFFLYFEEVDFFYRAYKAGWETWYVPASKVIHIEGASTGIKLVKRRPQYWYESRRRLFIKLYGVLGLVTADVLWALGRSSYVIRRFLKLGAQKPNHDPKWYSFDLLYGDMKSVLTLNAWRLKPEKVR